MNKDNLMTIPELMKFLQVKRNTIYTLRRLGLPTVKIGRSVRFRTDSIVKWLENMEQGSKEKMSGFLRPDSSSHLL
jgi:excisionase family DNA binding protein